VRPLPRSDLVLLAAVWALCGVGAFMVYSASLVMAYTSFQDDTYFLTKQITWIVIGLGVMFVLSRIDYHRWRKYTLLFLLAGIVLLVLVLVPSLGMTSYGSSRWLKLPLFQLQPSELIKLLLVLYMADWLAAKGTRVGEFFHSSLPFLIVQIVVCTLVVVEPDFGTTLVIAATSISIFFIAGANLVHFLAAMLAGTAASWYVIQSAAWRLERVIAWQDPWKDWQGAGWHTIQTLIALGSGGPTGQGLGAGLQKAGWLVNAHTDAILAILGEELGLVGTLAVLVLFGVVTWRGLRIAYRAPDAFGRLLAAGLTTMLFWQAAINVAVITNSVPYTGVTLPFISFGGNSTVVSLAAIGLLLSISRYRERPARHGRNPEAGGGGREAEGDEAASASRPPSVAPGRRRRPRPAAEPTREIVTLDAPLSLDGIPNAPRFRGRRRG
jgi:cell division protein FtsW